MTLNQNRTDVIYQTLTEIEAAIKTYQGRGCTDAEIIECENLWARHDDLSDELDGLAE